MKKDEKTKSNSGKDGQMTLEVYYDTIPAFPKKDFLEKICEACEININTARNWVAMRSRPQKPSHYRILSELTGIPAENLFPAD